MTGMELGRETEFTDGETNEVSRAVTVFMFLELKHRGQMIRGALTQRRGHRRFERALAVSPRPLP